MDKMNRYGCQIRETLAETGYKLVGFTSATAPLQRDKIARRNAIVREPARGRLELWTQNDDCAGYVLEIEGVGYEFVETL